MAKEGTVAEVATLPPCDFCKMNGTPDVPAGFDGRTKSGPWAFMCPTHFGLYGLGRLGTGIAQRLVLAVTETAEDPEALLCPVHERRHPLDAKMDCFEQLIIVAAEVQHERAYGA